MNIRRYMKRALPAAVLGFAVGAALSASSPASAAPAAHRPAGCSVVVAGRHLRHYHLHSGDSLHFRNLQVFCYRGTVYVEAR